MKQTIGQRLAELRKKSGLTQNELADKLMVSNKAVSKWESDNGNPSIEFLPSLSKILQCSIDYILTGTDFKCEEYKIPISFDMTNDDITYEDLCNFSHTIAYCQDEEMQNKLFDNIKNSILNSNSKSPIELKIINNNDNEILKILEELYKNTTNRQPLAVSITELSKHDSDYIYPATTAKPYQVLLVKEINKLILNQEYERLLNCIMNIGKSMGIFVVAVNTNEIISSYKQKFKTTIRYEIISTEEFKFYVPIFMDQLDLNDIKKEYEDKSKLKFPINLGYNNYQKLYFDFEYLLGTLITGETGSGKSNLLHHIITQIIKEYTSKEVQLALIDGKRVEFYPYFKLEHLFEPVAFSQESITELLKKCVDEMERRYDYLSKLGINCRDKLQDKQTMPYLLIIIDEVLELVQNKENLSHIQRLLQLGRACGIFMVIATQSQKENQIPSCITLNTPSKISFKLLTKELSKHYLGREGAEDLNVKGQMILNPAFDKPLTLQVPYLSDQYIKDIIKFKQ